MSNDTSSTRPWVFNRAKYIETLVLLVCGRKLPIDIVTWPAFQKFCLCLNPFIESDLIVSRSILVEHITKLYNFHRDELETKFQNAKSLIHISAGLWTSPDEFSYLGVHAQWVDENYTLKKMLIGLPECEFSQLGPYLATNIMEIIQQFNLGSKIGYFTGDTAGSNDTCLEAVSLALNNEHRVRK